MLQLTQFALLAAGVVLTTASAPLVPGVPVVQPLFAFMPLAIIEGGTVSTLPKSVKARGGKVVVLRGRADRGAAAQATGKPAAPRAVRQRAKSCACGAGSAARSGTGGSSSDVVELRNTENGLRVMILGPDGLARSRYVAPPPGATARHNQDD